MSSLGLCLRHYCAREHLCLCTVALANDQTGFGYKLRPSFMNSPKTPLKRDDQCPRRRLTQVLNSRPKLLMNQYTRGRMRLKTNSRSRFLLLVGLFAVRFLPKRYILQQKCLKGEIGTFMLGSRNMLVQLLALYTDPESHNAQRHRQTDRRTDRRQDYANSRSYCVAVVRSAKMFNVISGPVYSV